MRISELFNFTSNDYIRPPFIIAEAGVNHEGDIDLAYRLIDDAKEGGADAIKFQSYKADKIASKDSPAYWDLKKEPSTSQYKLFKKYDKFWKNEFDLLKKYCDKQEIEFLSTPFDTESANFLNDLMDIFKISSSDITNKPFIEYICDFRKPILLSTGASNHDEINDAVSWIEKKKIKLALLHCILNYPTRDENANLGMILDLKKMYPNFLIGYSDHTLPNDMKVLEIASLLGSTIIEKHFTHDKNLPGNDHYHAMDKNDLKVFKKNIDNIFRVIGNQKKFSLPTENTSRENARRSLVACIDIPKGTVIDIKHLTWKRPAIGICPSKIEDLIGKKSKTHILKDCILKWDFFN